MAWPLYTTTSEILHALAAKALGAKGTMKLYIRERGQGKVSVVSETSLQPLTVFVKNDSFYHRKSHLLSSFEEYYRLDIATPTRSRRWVERI
jgi:hypothetical protein